MPSSTTMSRVLHLQKAEGKPGEVYYPLALKHVPKPTPGPNQILLRIHAAALNHRDLFIRHHQYPAIDLSRPMLADACATVIALGPNCSRTNLLGRRVLIAPLRGWDSSPHGPEDPSAFAIIGSSALVDAGTAQDYMVLSESDVEIAPDHLSRVEAAALPLVGLTAWRALVTKACVEEKHNVLITGIGGGVALQALQFAVAIGANVYVTSGGQAKLDRAREMGASGGVNYKEKDWEKTLKAMLPGDRQYLDAVVDGAGGPIVGKAVRLLKPGGVIAQYGMTVSPKMDWVMAAVLNNVELRGTTMGSMKEFRDMISFVGEHKITPVVSRVVKGLDKLAEIDDLFSEMEKGKQFGKLVIDIDGGDSPKL